MSFTIQNLDTREGIPGLVIGTLVGQQGDVFTPFFNVGGAIVLEENQLKQWLIIFLILKQKISFLLLFLQIKMV